MNPFGLNDFQWVMFQLDAALTHNKRPSDVLNAVLNQYATAAEWVDKEGEWYLSDGGYSRVCFNERGKLFVTDNSTERVKDEWSECVELRELVERYIATAVGGALHD